ncbi:MAG TPA: hypothetical protein VFW78_07965 [Bacteroidia bacterium]|nr:hypothetical protein [Bacteroidia bacterium]
MKKVLLLTGLYLFICVVALGQDKRKNTYQTDSDIFMNKPNSIVEKKMITVGTLTVKYGMVKQDMEVNALLLKDTDTGEERQCMVFDVLDKGKYTMIESDEIDGMQKMLTMMSEQYLQTTPTSYTELVFNTRGGTEAGCFFDEDKWVIFMRLKKDDTQSTIEMTPASMEQLRGFIARVKEVLARNAKK